MSNDYSESDAGFVQSPDINSAGEPQARAVKDTGQAQRIVRSLLTFNRHRMIINSRITAKYNAEKPFRQAKMKSEGLGWKSNFTTKPLPQIVDKVAPRFEEAIEGLKFLTNSALPDDIPGATFKTEVFRKEITDTIRGRRGWKTLISDIAQENALFGYTAVVWLDDVSWWPKHFRQDQFLVPQGTKQDSALAQVCIVKESMFPHELFRYISDDRESAETAGWKIQETINQINKAMPESARLNSDETARAYEDMRRELNPGYAFEGGAKVVEVWSLFVMEVTGKVSHYRLAGDQLDLIFEKEDRFENMEDVMAFFSFQKANGTMHGSKGVGREIYELAGIIDRSRNEIVDRLMLSGKAFIQTDDKNVKRFRMSVVGNAILIGRGFTVLKERIDGDVAPFLQLDNYLGLIIDQLVGSVSPRQLQGERVTKAQVDLFAEREEETKDAKIVRFVEQFVSMMATMQKRLLDPETMEDDAKELQKRLLKVMSKEEMAMLREQKVAGTIKDLTPQERQQIVIIAQENQGNPLYNQRKLQEEKLSAQVNAGFAKKILLPDEDPTVVAEQTRLQHMELLLLAQGQPVQPSPRDNHEVHLGIVMPLLEQIANSIHEGGATTDTLELHANHAQEHYNMAIENGVDPDTLAPVKDILTKVNKAIAQLRELDAKAESVGAAGEALQQQSADEDALAAQSLAGATAIEQTAQ
jgi:hypothetical protein